MIAARFLLIYLPINDIDMSTLVILPLYHARIQLQAHNSLKYWPSLQSCVFSQSVE